MGNVCPRAYIVRCDRVLRSEIAVNSVFERPNNFLFYLRRSITFCVRAFHVFRSNGPWHVRPCVCAYRIRFECVGGNIPNVRFDARQRVTQ